MMKLWNKISNQLKRGNQFVRQLYLCLFNKKPTNFKTQLRKARRVVIACPFRSVETSWENQIVNIAQLFPSKGVVILHPDPKKIANEKLGQWATGYTENGSSNFWKLMTSSTLKKTTHSRFDVLIDLNDKSHLYLYYLCCVLYTPLRISFPKICGHQFYNLIFRSETEMSYSEKLTNFFHFLKPLC
jgi:hypothetical protein